MRYEKESLYLWASPFPSLSECCRWQWSGWCSSLSRRPRPSSSEKWPWIGWRICLSTRRARRASILSNFRPEFSTGNLTNYIQAWTCAVESFKQVFCQFVLSFQAKYNHSQMPSCRNLEPLVISYQKFKMFGQSHILCGIIRTFRHYWTFHYSTDWICLTFRICCCNPFTP